MRRDISLWCPVILAGLPAPRTCQKEYRWSLEEGWERIDDIRVKAPRTEAIRQGKYVQVLIQLETIVLVEGRNGDMGVISRTVHVSERVKWPVPGPDAANEGETGFILPIERLQWDAEIQDQSIVLRYTIEYMLYAIREQVIRLFQNDHEWGQRPVGNDGGEEGSNEMSRIKKENQALNRRLVFYQKDMSSLRHGLKKAEARNAKLCHELNGTRQIVQQLQDAVTRKDLLISRYRRNGATANPIQMAPAPQTNHYRGLGQRIRRLLLNCL